MLVFSKAPRSTIALIAVTATVGFGVSTADAGLAPARMSIEVSEQGGGVIFSSGGFVDLDTNFNAGNFWQFDAGNSAFNSGFFSVDGQINANNDIQNGGLSLAPTMNFVNNHSSTLEFRVIIERDASSTNGVSWNSDAGLTLGGGVGQTFFSLPGSSIWETFIDGNQVGGLFDDPSGLMSNGDGSVSLDTDAISGTNGQVTDSIALGFNFSLTPGADGGLNGIFVLTPAPGSLALLALGGFAGRRRRRQA